MKKRIFSPLLYFDGIKQLRIIGVLSTIAIALIGLISPVMRYLNTLDSVFTEYTVATVNYFEMNPLILLMFCAVAPLMALYLFSFLNKRESSDFYHAIPETRQCLFTSLFAAIITWLLFIIVFTTVVITFAYAILPQLYTVNYSSVFLTCFNAFAGSLLIAASVIIAMTVTGTVFSNVLVSLLLIFLPRLLILLAVMGVSDAFPLVNGLPFASVLSYEYNVPVGFVFGLIFSDYDIALTSLSSGIYTLIVGLIYSGIALLLFVRRSSETAGQSAPNRTLQAVYRLLIGAVLTSIAMYGLFDTLASKDSLDAEFLGTVVILLVISLVLMLAFEVITNRRFKGIMKCAATSIVALLVFGGVYLGGMYGLYHVAASYSPGADEIQSVSVLASTRFYGNADYFESKISEIELTDDTAKTIVAKQLKYSLDLLETSRDRFYRSNLTQVSVAIKSSSTTHLRNILMSEEDQAAMYSAVYDTEAFRKVYMDLPESVARVYTSHNGYSKSVKEDVLYQTLRAEVTEIGFEKWYALLSNTSEEDFYKVNPSAGSVLGYLECNLYEGTKWYNMIIPMDIAVLPKTTQAFLSSDTEAASESTKLLQLLREGTQLDKQDSLWIGCYNFPGDTPYSNVQLDEDVPKYLSDIQGLANSLTANTVPDVTKPFYCISFDDCTKVYEDGGKGYWHEYESYVCYYPGDELPEWLLTLYKEQAFVTQY
ncbi:MAG: hypothetical protein IKU56_00655 [Clostridia bacterium]|nr:hypothetical protein [Clostridia bacterium]